MLFKTGFRSRTQLAVRARETGLVILDKAKDKYKNKLCHFFEGDISDGIAFFLFIIQNKIILGVSNGTTYIYI